MHQNTSAKLPIQYWNAEDSFSHTREYSSVTNTVSPKATLVVEGECHCVVHYLFPEDLLRVHCYYSLNAQ